MGSSPTGRTIYLGVMMDSIARVELAHIAMKLTVAEWNKYSSSENIDDVFVRIYRAICWEVGADIGDEPENATVAQG